MDTPDFDTLLDQALTLKGQELEEFLQSFDANTATRLKEFISVGNSMKNAAAEPTLGSFANDMNSTSASANLHNEQDSSASEIRETSQNSWYVALRACIVSNVGGWP